MSTPIIWCKIDINQSSLSETKVLSDCLHCIISIICHSQMAVEAEPSFIEHCGRPLQWIIDREILTNM